MTVTITTIIPQFHFPKGNKSTPKHEQYILNTIVRVRQLFNYRFSLSELEFIPVSDACGLPRYLNMAFFRKLEYIGNIDMRVTLSAFIEGWTSVVRESKLDDDSVFFNILKKPNSPWISPDDFLPVLEDVVFNHPGLKFLGANPMFLERYSKERHNTNATISHVNKIVETVICRIFYEGGCATGRMNLSHFKRCNFVQMINNLGPEVDLNSTHDCFSYKHFYVLYCKFWVLDEDHDLIISENDLLNYNDGLLSQRITKQVMHHGRIPAFTKAATSNKHLLEEEASSTQIPENKLTFIDYIWFLMAETDKSTPTAIEYWFQCMDEDGDGIITTYDLSIHWSDQDRKLQDIIECYSDDSILFDDLIRQLHDLIQPEVSGQFRLKDLKRNGFIAERFFDTFLNIEKFQIHDTYQGLIRSIQLIEKERKRMYEIEKRKFIELHQQLQQAQVEDEEECIGTKVEEEEGDLERSDEQCYAAEDMLPTPQPITLGPWCDYAEKEYELLILGEQYSNVREEDEYEEEDEQEDENLNISVSTIPKTEEEIESPTSSSSDEHESDSSAPSTPIMQDLWIDDNNERWISNDQQDTTGGKTSLDNNKSTTTTTTGWIWDSSVNSE